VFNNRNCLTKTLMLFPSESNLKFESAVPTKRRWRWSFTSGANTKHAQ